MALRPYSTPTAEKPEQIKHNEPVQYSRSAAASWTAKQGRAGAINLEQIPGCQMYSVVGSVAIFLIYFCILREENDIDLELEKSLYDRVPGLERSQLVIMYKYNIENNIDNTDITTRMGELGMDPKDIVL